VSPPFELGSVDPIALTHQRAQHGATGRNNIFLRDRSIRHNQRPVHPLRQALWHCPVPVCCARVTHDKARAARVSSAPMSNSKRITELPPLPPRPLEGHKGMFGRVLIVGGNEGMVGAPAFAGAASLRTGAGLVQLATPRSILAAALSITPECIGLGLGKATAKDELLRVGEKADAIVIGPGLGQTPEALGRLTRLVRLEKPMVVDADGLNLLAKQKKWPKYFKASGVLTPHPGEMKRLAKLFGRKDVPDDDAGRIDIATQAARAFGQVVVLKGNRTVVADAQRVYVNHTGNSALSKAGTGDVLSGICGTLLAQAMDRFDAACAAVCLHGLAGEVAGERLGLRAVLAREVIDAIPAALKRYEERYG
jgi:NAD(P)H-hydrate epimerase